MFRLPEPKPNLTLYGLEAREVFKTKPQEEVQDQVEDQKKIDEAKSQVLQE